jgi:hypothetical protein
MFLVLLLFPFFTGAAFAEHVDAEKALRVATAFHQQAGRDSAKASLFHSGASSSDNDALTLVHTAASTLRSSAGDASYYVFNVSGEGGFISIAGDDRVTPILGYATQGAYRPATLPPAFEWWMQRYGEQIADAVTRSFFSPEIQQQWLNLEEGRPPVALRTGSAKLLNTAQWNQDTPYNDLCPLDATNSRTLTGCIATGMAIIMKYHRWPASGTGSHSYVPNGWNGTPNPVSARFDGLYDWTKMPDSYASGATSAAQKAEVAKLMFHCGVSVDALYGKNVTSSASMESPLYALRNYFRYDNRIDVLYRQKHLSPQWLALIKRELDQNRPFLYGGQNVSSGGGHLFVCSGYDEEDKLFLNWGWGGYYNGYYALDAFHPEPGNYSSNEYLIFHIEPRDDDAATSDLWITDISGIGFNGLALYKENTPVRNVIPGESFLMTVSYLRNRGLEDFNGLIAAVVTSANSAAIKGNPLALSTPLLIPARDRINFNLSIPDGWNGWNPTSFQRTDLIRIASSTDDGATWQLIDGSADVQSLIPVVATTGVSLNMHVLAKSVRDAPVALTPTVSPPDASIQAVIWSTSHANVATVEEGVVTFVGAGSTTITATTVEGGFSDACEVTVATPCAVTWPAMNGISTSPEPDTYYVESGQDFVFTILPGSVPADADLLVTTHRPNRPAENDVVIRSNEDGSYTVIIKDIREMLTLEISCTTENIQVAGLKVWASDGTLHLTTDHSGEAKVYQSSGLLVKSVPFAANETIQTPLAAGIYIITVDGSAYKVRVK